VFIEARPVALWHELLTASIDEILREAGRCAAELERACPAFEPFGDLACKLGAVHEHSHYGVLLQRARIDVH
jgi:hypothetical protein